MIPPSPSMKKSGHFTSTTLVQFTDFTGWNSPGIAMEVGKLCAMHTINNVIQENRINEASRPHRFGVALGCRLRWNHGFEENPWVIHVISIQFAGGYRLICLSKEALGKMNLWLLIHINPHKYSISFAQLMAILHIKPGEFLGGARAGCGPESPGNSEDGDQLAVGSAGAVGWTKDLGDKDPTFGMWRVRVILSLFGIKMWTFGIKIWEIKIINIPQSYHLYPSNQPFITDHRTIILSWIQGYFGFWPTTKSCIINHSYIATIVDHWPLLMFFSCHH